LSEHSAILELAERVRTTTLVHLRTEVKDAITRLRDTLDPEDRELLILRVNRELSWVEVARVFEGIEADEAAIQRRSATLRKRYERVKVKLRELARGEGLL